MLEGVRVGFTSEDLSERDENKFRTTREERKEGETFHSFLSLTILHLGTKEIFF